MSSKINVRYRVVDSNRRSLFVSGKYRFIYRKGEVVSAVLGSVGIFCFKTLRGAQVFLSKFVPSYGKILRVKPLSKGRTPKTICQFTRELSIDAFYENSEYSIPVKETQGLQDLICYQKIEVLD